MKKLFFLKSVVVLIITTLLFCLTGAGNENTNQPTLKHIVCLKFKASATTEDINNIIKAFCELKNKIPEIKNLEWGMNNSPEKLNKGFTHCFILTFKNEKDRDSYLVHPDHKEFGKKLGQILEDVFVVDYTPVK